MIQANELRIDNWIYLNNCAKKIIWVKYNSTCVMNEYPSAIVALDRIKPIPLTEEIIIKCGFERSEYNDYRHPVLIGTLTLYKGVAELHISDLYSAWVNNLHQLQNLYFALCGKELEVTL